MSFNPGKRETKLASQLILHLHRQIFNCSHPVCHHGNNTYVPAVLFRFSIVCKMFCCSLLLAAFLQPDCCVLFAAHFACVYCIVSIFGWMFLYVFQFLYLVALVYLTVLAHRWVFFVPWFLFSCAFSGCGGFSPRGPPYNTH